MPKSVSIGYRRKELAVVPRAAQDLWRFPAWGVQFTGEQMENFDEIDAHMDPHDPGKKIHEGPSPDGKALSRDQLEEQGPTSAPRTLRARSWWGWPSSTGRGRRRR